MKKRIISLLLAIILIFSLAPAALAGVSLNLNRAETLYKLGLFKGTGVNADGTPAFELERAPTRAEAVVMLIRLLGLEKEALSGERQTPFNDVEAWALPYIGCAFEKGLALGNGDGTFGSADNVTASQYLTFVLRALGYSSDADFKWDSAWTLSDEIGLTDGSYGENTRFTRGDTALISHDALSRTLKGTEQTLLSRLCENGAVSRTAVAEAGLSSLLPSRELSSGEIYEKCSPAAFYIEVYYASGTSYTTGSGFFIEKNGVAVTNFHVIEGAASAVITTADGKERKVLGVYDYDTENDLALIKVEGGDYPTLELSYSASLNTGSRVYAIGSPEGLENTMTSGTVSYLKKEISGRDFIQCDAPVAHGSSGGALIDGFGNVVGVTTAGLENNTSVNFSVPARYIDFLSRKTLRSFADGATSGLETPYIFCDAVPSFGNYFGVRSSSTERTDELKSWCYSEEKLPASAVADYSSLLEKHGFASLTPSSGTREYIKGGVNVNISHSVDLSGERYVVVSVAVSELPEDSAPPAAAAYAKSPSVPDFGAYFGMTPIGSYTVGDTMLYDYSIPSEDAAQTYCALLQSRGFSLSRYLAPGIFSERHYIKDGTEVRLTVGAYTVTVAVSPLQLPSNVYYYQSAPTVPDFGASFGIPVFEARLNGDNDSFYYAMTAAESVLEYPLSSYCAMLINSGFICTDFYNDYTAGVTGSNYEKGTCTLFVGTTTQDVGTFLTVAVYDSSKAKSEHGYDFCGDVPDFGAYFGVETFYSYYPGEDSAVYYYIGSDVEAVSDSAVSDYLSLLRKWGFTYAESYDGGSEINGLYYGKDGIVLFIGRTVALGDEFIVVNINLQS